jgi:hypothetical protein
MLLRLTDLTPSGSVPCGANPEAWWLYLLTAVLKSYSSPDSQHSVPHNVR